jgi:hypothetical protein
MRIFVIEVEKYVPFGKFTVYMYLPHSAKATTCNDVSTRCN